MTTSEALLDHLQRDAHDPDRKILLTHATIVTMDPAIGILDRGDLLIQGATIRAVAPDLRAQGAAEGAIVIDATGSILCPGLVDTHRHAWQTQLRRMMPDLRDLSEYVAVMLARFGPVYTPEDMYIGTKLAALTAIDGGVTCMLDFSNNARSAAHSDSAIQALIDTGIRGVHASLGASSGTWDKQWPADLTRLRERYFSSTDQLLTLRLAAVANNPKSPELTYGPALSRVARDLDISVSIDAVLGASSSEAILSWTKAGLLGPHVTLIHATGQTAEAWRAIADTGATVALAPTSDAQLGLDTAIPAIDEALAVGIRPGLSIDVEVALASDMFTQMRALHTIQRMRAVNAVHGTAAQPPSRLTARDVLDFATLQGARTNGLEGVTGSLTLGKQADLLVIRAEDLNNMPINDPIGTVVLGSDSRNIDAVFIAGQVRKWDGRVIGVDLDSLRRDVRTSRDRLLSAVAR